MRTVLKIAALSVGALMLSSSLALAQATPDPGTDAGRKPAAGQPTPGRGRGKKAAKKKTAARKKGAKKPATTQPPK